VVSGQLPAIGCQYPATDSSFAFNYSLLATRYSLLNSEVITSLRCCSFADRCQRPVRHPEGTAAGHAPDRSGGTV